MIVVSVLLILVAVTLLVLGLADGSSTLLISSIAASLLAAVALVIGARQAANMRRAAIGDPVVPGGRSTHHPHVDVDYDAGAPVSAASGSPASGFSASGSPPESGSSASRSAAAGSGGGPGVPGFAGADACGGSAEPSFADNPPAADEGLASPVDAKPRVANRDDAEAALAADAAYREANAGPEPAYSEAGRASGGYPDVYGEPGSSDGEPASGAAYRDAGEGQGESAYPDPPGDRAYGGSDSAAYPGTDPGDSADDRAYRDLDSALGGATPASDAAGRDEVDPDYDRASSFIGGARSENPTSNAWRRSHADDGRLDSGPVGAEDPLGPEGAGLRSDAGRGEAPGEGLSAGSGFSGLAEEFGEPDADDPDDEPLPQAVRPADAVRVARMTAEVEVVDGRPRYHLSDCPHLVGRQTEPLPVSEAVELGFSPCGLCRPVDHLVAQAARR